MFRAPPNNITAEKFLNFVLGQRGNGGMHQDADNTPSSSITKLHRMVALHATTGEDVREYLRHHNPVIGPQCLSPLHVAVVRNSYHALDVVQALLDHYSSSLVTTEWYGNIALDLYLEHAQTLQKSMVQLLIPSEDTQERRSKSLGLLYRNVMRFRWARQWELLDRVPENVHTMKGRAWMTIVTPHDFLELALLIVASTSTRSHETTSRWHEICQLPQCPPLLIRLLLFQREESSDKVVPLHLLRDGEGRTLLHCAARASNASSPLQPGGWPTLISVLTRAQPELLHCRDHQGHLPCHDALSNATVSSRDLELMIFQNYPDVLDEKDPVSALSPVFLYASREDNVDLNFLFRMVQAHPTGCYAYK